MSQPLRTRVLVIDDDDALCESLREVLQARGYEVLIAKDGSAGLMRIERDHPNLVLMDLVMPHRSGLTVLQRIFHGRPGAPHIILMSASQDPLHAEWALDHGAVAFVHKPFDIDELLAILETCSHMGSAPAQPSPL